MNDDRISTGAAAARAPIAPAGASADEVAARVQRVFVHLHATRMQDMPFVNAALAVEAVGFHRWEGRWLGVLITPWFMNLMLLPDEAGQWQHVRYGDSAAYALPAGVFEFISAFEPMLGDYQSCSLFSPMFEFGDQDGARATAQAALQALFDPETRAGAEGQAQRDAARVEAPARAPVSKRDFLRGRWLGGNDIGASDAPTP